MAPTTNQVQDNAAKPVLAPSREVSRSIVSALYRDLTIETGESSLAHADGMCDILAGVRNDDSLFAAAYLFQIGKVLSSPNEWIERGFGSTVLSLVLELQKLIDLSHKVRSENKKVSGQPDTVRRMLLAMCSDLRVVLLRLASRLQTMRYFAKTEQKGPLVEAFAEETLALYAPLANRLGIWQMKWELEDMGLRFSKPDVYRTIANQLDESREERLQFMAHAVDKIRALLSEYGISGTVSGRPKHIYSIYKKMERKHLRFDQLFDIRAMRITVQTVEQCYETLSLIQKTYDVLPEEFDDYIAHPKPNGYQSLHTVVIDENGRTIEIQIRTQAMHEFAELGVAAHWRYKETGNSEKGDSGEEQRVAWLRQLLAWSSDVTPSDAGQQLKETRIYALTPQGRVLELPAGATPIDFAYQVHTQLGHRCRGAKVNGQMVSLNTVLKTGDTVEITAAKSGGPSRDWLNMELGYAVSPRTIAKVRQWFNAQLQAQQIAQGRERLDKELARMGKSTFKLEDIAKRLKYDGVDALCQAFAKEEFSVTALSQVVNPTEAPVQENDTVVVSKRKHTASGKVLVVGVDSIMTQLAKCCHPAPPDEIIGFVTRGKGVTIHRVSCPNMHNMETIGQERIISVAWSENAVGEFPVDIIVVSKDRVALLKDLSEVFVREQVPIIGINTLSVKNDAHLRFSVLIPSAAALSKVLTGLREVSGVMSARRA